MNKARLEKNIAVILFFAVLIMFSYAEQESKKIQKLYTIKSPAAKAPLAEKLVRNHN